MESTKHIVIFSHGFGVRKDDRGLLAGEFGISEALEKDGIECVLFDYNKIDANDDLTVRPLSEQVPILADVLENTSKNNPGAVIDLIAHSQGNLPPCVLLPQGIRRSIFLAPSLDVNNERLINIFKDRPGTEINIDGVSKLARADGTITFVPASYWAERAQVHPIEICNAFSEVTDLTIINALDDNIRKPSTEGLHPDIKILGLPGNHQFSGEARARLIEKIKEIIYL